MTPEDSENNQFDAKAFAEIAKEHIYRIFKSCRQESDLLEESQENFRNGVLDAVKSYQTIEVYRALSIAHKTEFGQCLGENPKNKNRILTIIGNIIIESGIFPFTKEADPILVTASVIGDDISRTWNIDRNPVLPSIETLVPISHLLQSLSSKFKKLF